MATEELSSAAKKLAERVTLENRAATMNACAEVLATECGQLRREMVEIRDVLAKALYPEGKPLDFGAVQLAHEAALVIEGACKLLHAPKENPA